GGAVWCSARGGAPARAECGVAGGPAVPPRGPPAVASAKAGRHCTRHVHVAQWTRAEASEASGCAFDSRRGLHLSLLKLDHGELAERQGIAVLTRRDRKVAQVRFLHSPPPRLRACRPPSSNGSMLHFECGDRGSNP